MARVLNGPKNDNDVRIRLSRPDDTWHVPGRGGDPMSLSVA